MKKRRILFIFVVCIFFLSFSLETFVLADDDHYEDDERKERYYDWEDEDEHDEKANSYEEWNEEESNDQDEYYERDNLNNSSQIQSFWNIWVRETTISETENLPVQNPQDVDILLGNQREKMYIIPRNGQLLVSVEKIAQQLQVDFQFYEQSKIVEIHKGDTELIVRSGSNVAYENMVRVPMPTKAYFMENSLYLPISVITNAFGYRVNWNNEGQFLQLEKIR